jgi:histidinol dehydrogenase
LSGLPNIKILEVSSIPPKLLGDRWPRAKKFDSELADYVGPIVEEVHRRGDDALVDFATKYDAVKLSPDRLRVGKEDIEKAYERVTEEQLSAIRCVKSRVEAFQRELLSRMSFEYTADGVKVRTRTSPIRRIGCYVPSGQAAYPSSLIMTVIPAKVAEVPQVVICSPPESQGEINPLILVAADICGVDEIYRVGGVPAVAALAYGTETIAQVDKLFGPGNKYVMMAKMLVSRDVPTDLPAGPSEILVLADGTADARLIASDMVSQSEHRDGISLFVTTSRENAKKVVRELKQMVSSLPNRETVTQNLSRNCYVLVCKDMEEATRFVNDFAPEHLEVMAQDSWSVSEDIESAGLVLIGKHTPVSASDYCLGTIHVLPTEGFSHVYSGLSVFDFVKRFNVVECSEEGLLKVRKNVKILAESEGLPNHALAVEARFKDE